MNFSVLANILHFQNTCVKSLKGTPFFVAAEDFVICVCVHCKFKYEIDFHLSLIRFQRKKDDNIWDTHCFEKSIMETHKLFCCCFRLYSLTFGQGSNSSPITYSKSIFYYTSSPFEQFWMWNISPCSSEPAGQNSK